MNLHPHTLSGAGRALRLSLASAAAVTTLLLAPTAVGAQTYAETPPPTGPPSVLPNTQVNTEVKPAVTPVAVNTAARSTAAKGGLAVTGGDVAGLAALGGTAVAAGTGLVLASRRRRATV
jgi:hypothetical protein